MKKTKNKILLVSSAGLLSAFPALTLLSAGEAQNTQSNEIWENVGNDADAEIQYITGYQSDVIDISTEMTYGSDRISDTHKDYANKSDQTQIIKSIKKTADIQYVSTENGLITWKAIFNSALPNANDRNGGYLRNDPDLSRFAIYLSDDLEFVPGSLSYVTSDWLESVRKTGQLDIDFKTNTTIDPKKAPTFSKATPVVKNKSGDIPVKEYIFASAKNINASNVVSFNQNVTNPRKTYSEYVGNQSSLTDSFAREDKLFSILNVQRFLNRNMIIYDDGINYTRNNSYVRNYNSSSQTFPNTTGWDFDVEDFEQHQTFHSYQNSKKTF
ncbi:hypothetical protein [Mycoplasma sp. Ms02]|uniref:hypothetical protein n=1 Tax=Mycoplasma sp. Ms02 TaxID=353851 RepID=UPI001C89F6E5|nr:hypothetical protein [Mycoplasma sp. Ms02]QZE12454.1 hypothetical protein K4L35_00465 [Mycoplasma sp. Ms02]